MPLRSEKCACCAKEWGNGHTLLCFQVLPGIKNGSADSNTARDIHILEIYGNSLDDWQWGDALANRCKCQQQLV